jgi:hypothetical protein
MTKSTDCGQVFTQPLNILFTCYSQTVDKSRPVDNYPKGKHISSYQKILEFAMRGGKYPQYHQAVDIKLFTGLNI